MAVPAVSVLLTAYNRERFIGPAIESVLSQTFDDFELVIVDDRSADSTVDIVRRYLGDARVRLVVNEKNLGDYPNRNRAASLARGRFLKYHDSDDLMYPHCLATMVEPLERHPQAAFALSGSRYWTGGPCPMLLTPRLAFEREFLGTGLFHLGPACALFRSEAFAELGGFPEQGVASDYLFWLRSCARVNVLLVPGDLFYYRLHPGQELTNPEAVAQYARASAVAWRMLKLGECPLDGAALNQARRNFVFSTARGSFRYLRRARVKHAWDTAVQSGPSAIDWLQYLRPPHRTPFAGTPSHLLEDI